MALNVFIGSRVIRCFYRYLEDILNVREFRNYFSKEQQINKFTLQLIYVKLYLFDLQKFRTLYSLILLCKHFS